MASSSIPRPLLVLAAALAATSVSARPSLLAPRHCGYTRLGCYTDNVGGTRALGGIRTAADDMTTQKCAAFCSKYELFGLEYGRECYCGNTRDPSSTEVADADCTFKCAGDPDGSGTCGAVDRLDLYSNSHPEVLVPASLPGVTSLGCFVDNARRVLPSRRTVADDMTAAKCAGNCAGYDYFGTQYSSECYCGSVAPTVSAPMSECDMPCSGAETEACGGGMRLNVYKIDSTSTETGEPSPTATGTPSFGKFQYVSCWTDSVQDRSLTGHNHSGPDMTVELCAAICEDYAFFGVEYARECFCGDELGGVAAPEAECGMRCEGGNGQWCGGPDRMNVYSKAAPTPSATATDSEPTPSVSAPASDEATAVTDSEPTPSVPAPISDEAATATPSEPAPTSDEATIATDSEPTPSEPAPISDEATTATDSEPTPSVSAPISDEAATAAPSESAATSDEATTATDSEPTPSEPAPISDEATTATVAAPTSDEMATATPEPTPILGVNLITDGGFEDGLGTWSLVSIGVGSTYFSNSNAKSGSMSFMISLGSAERSNVALISSDISVTPGGQYTFTVPYLHFNPTIIADASITLSVLPDAVESTAEEAALQGTPVEQWLEKTLTFVASGPSVKLMYVISGVNDNISIDDISLVRIS